MAPTDETYETNPDRRWFRGYIVFMATMAVVAVFALIFGIVGMFTNARQDAEQQASNQARDDTTAELLRCFDEWSQSSSSVSTVVREASVRVSETTEARDQALLITARGFRSVLNGEVDPEVLQTNLDLLTDASRELQRASRELARVREENPIPRPPSSFCRVTTDDESDG